MSSSTVALVTGDALASALMTSREFKPENFALYHPGGNLGRRLLLKVVDAMEASRPRFSSSRAEADATRIVECDEPLKSRGLVVAMTGESLASLQTAISGARSSAIFLGQPIRELMTEDLITIPVTDALGQALDRMEQSGRKIYFFAPVVDPAGALHGALRMHECRSDGT